MSGYKWQFTYPDFRFPHKVSLRPSLRLLQVNFCCFSLRFFIFPSTVVNLKNTPLYLYVNYCVSICFWGTNSVEFHTTSGLRKQTVGWNLLLGWQWDHNRWWYVKHRWSLGEGGGVIVKTSTGELGWNSGGREFIRWCNVSGSWEIYRK